MRQPRGFKWLSSFYLNTSSRRSLFAYSPSSCAPMACGLCYCCACLISISMLHTAYSIFKTFTSVVCCIHLLFRLLEFRDVMSKMAPKQVVKVVRQQTETAELRWYFTVFYFTSDGNSECEWQMPGDVFLFSSVILRAALRFSNRAVFAWTFCR